MPDPSSPTPSPSPSTLPPLRVGIMFEGIQYADLACLDILGNLSTKIVQEMTSIGGITPHLLSLSRPITWFSISSSLSPAFMIPAWHAVPTHTYDSAPRDLDLLVIGGPFPVGLPDRSLKFLRECVYGVEGGVDGVDEDADGDLRKKRTKYVMSVCTGGCWLAAAGVLDGRPATTNRAALPLAKKMFPAVEWRDQRWVVEQVEGGSEIWTSGGAGAGIDMMALWCRQQFDDEIVDTLGVKQLDFDPDGSRGQFYHDS